MTGIPVRHLADRVRPFPRRPHPLALAAALMVGGSLTPAWAQSSAPSAPSAPEEPAERNALSVVVVTGTNIRGAGPVGTPVIGISREEIGKIGGATTTDLLRVLPQIQNLGADEGHTNPAQNANQNITVGSGINLRGLGPESTLTLVNGRRVAPGGVAGQYVDPSSIPPLAIDRLEVITDGASATYGSDAVGGVVNIRLRSNFNGAEATARYGAADGMHQKQAGAIVGKAWSTGSAMVALDYNFRSALSADDRAFYTDDLRPWGGPDLRGFNASPGNIQVGSTRYAIPAGQNGVGLAPGKLVAGTANLQSANKGVSALPEQNRKSALFSFNQSLGERVAVTVEGFWTQRDFMRNLTAFNGNYTVRNTNPFFVSPTGATSASVNYSFFNDLGTAVSTGFERSHQIAAGLDVELGAGWGASVQLSRSVTQERNLSPAINNNAINTALADTNSATALNLFCDGGSFACNNPATLAKLPAFSDRNSRYTLHDLTVKADGPLFNMPGGTARLAVGGEYHTDKLPYFLIVNNTTPDTTTTKTTTNASVNPERTVKSLFAELLLPLVGKGNAMPGVERLDVSLSARSERYSDFGSTSNPKLALGWTPVGGLEVHAATSTAFRAPTLGDTDPVNGSAVNVVNYVGADGKTTLRGINYLGGNPSGLKPETARIRTLGMSFRPTSVPGMLASLDWFDIRYKDRILTPGNDTTILQKPELAAYLSLPPTAAQVQAAIANPVYSGSPTEPVAGIQFIADGRRYNAGVVNTSGVDFVTRYQWASAVGDFTVGLSGTYVIKYQQQFTPTTPIVTNLLNTLNNPMRLRARGELGWAQGPWRVNSYMNFTNRYTNGTLATRPGVAESITFDLTTRYLFNASAGLLKGLSLTLAAQNLTDETPPYVQNGTLAFDPQNVSAIGRMVSVAISKAW
ncbi:MAG: TonB-dependent receptor [Rubrivivax sp.]|nr:MAG: TonB-dependent receptor [Rubrivivax sp.]